ncbi:MAG: hypothetical protein HC896_03700 [Bacteroidales bacterium]|nr:hypothetical protein [Bacteroidales bacterium]
MELTESSYIRDDGEDHSYTLSFNGTTMTYTGKKYNFSIRKYIDTTYSYPYSSILTIKEDNTYIWEQSEDTNQTAYTDLWYLISGTSGNWMLGLEAHDIYKLSKISGTELDITKDVLHEEEEDTRFSVNSTYKFKNNKKLGSTANIVDETI